MALGKFNKSSGFAALAAALAMLVVPASASAQDRGGWRGGGGEARAQGGGNGGGWRGNGGGWRGQSQGGEAQSQPRAERNWSRDGDGNGRGNGAWRGREAQASPPAMTQAAPAPERNFSRRSADEGTVQWQGRNRSYVDPNRAIARENSQRLAQERNDRWRSDGNRDGNRWRGNDNDNSRWQGNNNWRGDRRGYADNRNWNRNWRSDNRYDWNRYRTSNRSIYRLGTYYAPYRGYSYRRVGIGFGLDSLFFGSNYWINDPWQYRLPDAYGPYRWVRYYDDALLVDIYSGEVVDAIYDFFW